MYMFYIKGPTNVSLMIVWAPSLSRRAMQIDRSGRFYTFFMDGCSSREIVSFVFYLKFIIPKDFIAESR